jgi:hypothetical protein
MEIAPAIASTAGHRAVRNRIKMPSETAQRPRAMLPGGSGYSPFSHRPASGQTTIASPSASRVSISELLGCIIELNRRIQLPACIALRISARRV